MLGKEWKKKYNDAMGENHELKTQVSELKARIDVYEIALANAGLKVLKQKATQKTKEEFGFVPRKTEK